MFESVSRYIQRKRAEAEDPILNARYMTHIEALNEPIPRVELSPEEWADNAKAMRVAQALRRKHGSFLPTEALLADIVDYAQGDEVSGLSHEADLT